MGTLGEKNLHGKYPKSLCIKIFRMFHVTDRWFNNQVKFQAVQDCYLLFFKWHSVVNRFT